MKTITVIICTLFGGGHILESITNREGQLIKLIIRLVLAILVIGVIFRFVLMATVITSGSMESTLKTGDHVLGFRLAYTFTEPERGDIIVFPYPVDETQLVVKRIIGLPGETVDIRNGKIFINGSKRPLKESYLKNTWVIDNDGYHFTVPENSYFMLGDNRDISLDSRFWAEEILNKNEGINPSEAEQYRFVSRDHIMAKLLFSISPFSSVGFLH